MFNLRMIHEMDNLQREMDQLFRGLGFGQAVNDMRQSTSFSINDSGDAFRVEASLPGLDMEKLAINILGRRLTLTGEYAQPEVAEEAVWHRRERNSGRLEKTLLLPANVDSEQVEAEYRHGTLSIILPKAASARPKKISVKAA